MSARVLIILSLALVTVMAGAPQATRSLIPPAAVTPSPSPLQTGNLSKAQTQQLASNEQVPFVFCPESVGLPMKVCSKCGGDSKKQGVCDDLLLSGRQRDSCFSIGQFCQGYYCQCIHDGTDNNHQVTSTAVVSGQTGTIVFEPRTFTQYSKLRAMTTVTFTETATTSGGGSSLQTVGAALFAGGVAWWAIAQSGPAAAMAAIQPPTEPPDGSRNDDQECKTNSKEECKNCGGADNLGLCASGTEAGCPCDEEEQECSEKPSKCSDSSCGGDNGQSRCKGDGKTKGCACCPDQPSDCNNKDCGGGPDALCTGDKLKKCPCQVFGSAILVGPEANPTAPSDADASSIAGYLSSKIWGGKVPGTAPLTPTQSCAPTTTTRKPDELASFTFLPPVDCFCTCGPTMVGLTWGTSATATSSWCLPGEAKYAPSGWTQIPGKHCTGFGAPTPTTTSSLSPPPSPTPTTTPPPSCDHGWCGAPLCCGCYQGDPNCQQG